MSATSETLLLIELMLARLHQDIDANAATGSAATDQFVKPRSDLLQAAWGKDCEPLSINKLDDLASGLPHGIEVDLSGLTPGTSFPAPIRRIMLNLLLLAAECLPSGGDVMLAGSADDLFMRIEGDGAGWPAGMGACLVDEAVAHAAMTAGGSSQMPLTALLARAAGIRLSFLLSPGAGPGSPILRIGGR